MHRTCSTVLLLTASLLLSGCGQKYDNYELLTYEQLEELAEDRRIDWEAHWTFQPLEDTHLLDAYIAAAEKNCYTARFIMEGLYPEQHGLVYNVYIKNDADYFLEQFVLTDEQTEVEDQETVDVSIGVAGKYYIQNANQAMAETEEPADFHLFFEDFSYLRSYRISSEEETYTCEQWCSAKGTPYLFCFDEEELVCAAVDVSLSDGNANTLHFTEIGDVVYYFIEFTDEPDTSRIQAP